MNRIGYVILGALVLIINFNLYGQNTGNCFLDDFQLKTAVIPPSVGADKPTGPASVTVTINSDTLGEISKYVFGNAIAAWAGAHDYPTFVTGVKLLAPTLIRFPGGSWADGYFWNGIPSDVPDSIYDGTTYNPATGTAKKAAFGGQSGVGSWPTSPDQYYTLRKKVDDTQGLITINYAYARYGTSKDPVAQAAHLAADWVRYDSGRTKFWEIGNENAGPWEYGWMIDTTINKDGQPQIISGDLYGKHFKVFFDSMKAAAKEIGATIYIGGQVMETQPTPPYMWFFVDSAWDRGFFNEVGDSVDFYVIHNYYGGIYTASALLDSAVSELDGNIDFVRRDVKDKGGFPKPVALTEYNIGGGATSTQQTSYINGMQAAVLVCEMIKKNFGLGARWLLLSGTTSMFYGGMDSHAYHPHPDFYYLYYLQKFYGDHAISTSSSSSDIFCYASRFSSGETGLIIVNKGTADQVIGVKMDSIGVGTKYYVYSFTGGTDNGDFSQNVYINGYGPDVNHWGPYNELSTLPASSYAIDKIKFNSPARSVQMVMIEGGNNVVSVNDKADHELPHSYSLYQNYPNPFNPSTAISYQVPMVNRVTIEVYDVLGREVKTLVNGTKFPGNYEVKFDASDLPSGVYFYRMTAANFSQVKKLLLLK